jgi:fatty acid amide hydrolase 2
MLGLLQSGQGLVRGRLAQAARLGAELQVELEAALGPTGVLLHPPYTRAAPRHRLALLTPFDFVCSGLFSVLEFPVTQVPLGFGSHGLPLGVQVIARRRLDHVTLAAAAALEAEWGGWVRANP